MVIEILGLCIKNCISSRDQFASINIVKRELIEVVEKPKHKYYIVFMKEARVLLLRRPHRIPDPKQMRRRRSQQHLGGRQRSRISIPAIYTTSIRG